MLWNNAKSNAAVAMQPAHADGLDPDTRAIIADTFQRLRDNGGERDPAAEAAIRAEMERDPGTAYYLTQMVVFQEQALGAANARIQELETQAQQKQGGILGSLFGGKPAPQPRRPMGAQGRPGTYGAAGAYGQGGYGQGRQGMFANRPQGSFLGGAAQMALGVMGGMLLGSAIMGMLGMDEAQAAEEAPAEEPAADEAGANEDYGGGEDFGGGDEF